MNYSLIDSDGRCVNTLAWDGKSNWTPPANTTLVAGQTLNVGAQYSLINGQWYLIPDPEPEQETIPQWVQFGAALAVNSGVNTMVATAAVSAPVLHLMLGVGLGQAAQGDPKTFMAAWSNARAVGLVSQELADEMVTIGSNYDLPQEFLDQLNVSTP